MNSKSMLGLTLIVLVACLAGGGIYAAHQVRKAKFDLETLCPIEGSRHFTLIVIDKTDPLTVLEHSRVRNIVRKRRDLAERGDRISIKLLRQQESSNEIALDTIVDLCNPGAEANPIFENPKHVAARYRDAFLEPIDAALTGIAAQGSALASPIARAIRSSMEASAGTVGKPLTLILVSDLMEHSPDASAYSGTFGDAALRKLMGPQAQAQLKGADVEILLLPRSRYAAQQDAALAVWRRFFKEATGRDPAIARP